MGTPGHVEFTTGISGAISGYITPILRATIYLPFVPGPVRVMKRFVRDKRDGIVGENVRRSFGVILNS